MVTIITGDDSQAINNFLKHKKSQLIGASIHEFNKEFEYDSNFRDLFLSAGLFSEKKLIIIQSDKYLDQIEPEELVKLANSESDVELVIIGDFSARLKALDGERNIRMLSFDKRPDYSLYQIADSLFIEGDKKKAIQKFTNMDNFDSQKFFAVSVFHSAIRNALSAEFKNETYEKLKPFIKNKFSRSNRKIDFKTVYKKLFELDCEMKSLPSSDKAKIIDFMIQCE